MGRNTCRAASAVSTPSAMPRPSVGSGSSCIAAPAARPSMARPSFSPAGRGKSDGCGKARRCEHPAVARPCPGRVRAAPRTRATGETVHQRRRRASGHGLRGKPPRRCRAPAATLPRLRAPAACCRHPRSPGRGRAAAKHLRRARGRARGRAHAANPPPPPSSNRSYWRSGRAGRRQCRLRGQTRRTP